MPTRLTTLRNRYEMLIEANLNYGYMQSLKADRYLKLIKSIKAEIRHQEAKNKSVNEKSQWYRVLQSTKGLNGFEILIK